MAWCVFSYEKGNKLPIGRDHHRVEVCILTSKGKQRNSLIAGESEPLAEVMMDVKHALNGPDNRDSSIRFFSQNSIRSLKKSPDIMGMYDACLPLGP